MKTKDSKWYKKALDKVFSEYIRRKNADWRGNVSCYTCGCSKHWKEMQCGHFVRRQYLNLRWSEDNARVQCYACNIGRGGNYDVFALKLIQEKGVEFLEELQKKKNTLKKWKVSELENLLEEYKTKISKI